MSGGGLILVLLLGFCFVAVVAVGASLYNAVAEAYPFFSMAIVALFAIVAVTLIAMYAVSHNNNSN